MVIWSSSGHLATGQVVIWSFSGHLDKQCTFIWSSSCHLEMATGRSSIGYLVIHWSSGHPNKHDGSPWQIIIVHKFHVATSSRLWVFERSRFLQRLILMIRCNDHEVMLWSFCNRSGGHLVIQWSSRHPLAVMLSSSGHFSHLVVIWSSSGDLVIINKHDERHGKCSP